MAGVSFLRLHEPMEDFDFDQEEILAYESGFPYCSHAFGADSDPISLNGHHIHQDNDFYSETCDQFGGLIGNTTSGSGSFEEILDRENQVTFVMDLLQQRVEQSHSLAIESLELDPILESGFVVERNTEETGANSVELEFGEVLGLGTDFDGNRDLGHGDEEDVNFGGFVVSNCGDEFYVSRRESGNNSGGSTNGGRDGDGINRFSGGLNVVGFESDSEEDVDGDLLDSRLHLEDDFASPIRCNDENLDLCWDSLQLDDHRDVNEEFEWEDVDEGLYGLNLDEYDPIIGSEQEEIREILQVGSRTTPWEVLLNNNNDYIDTSEYEMAFGQFTEVEDASMGRPPASKLAVESLPLVVVTEADVQNGNAVCAVCKDEMGAGEQAKQLPCSHRYHDGCITPWLGIRNSCPVCRHELPTDDPDYELRRNRRAARAMPGELH